MLCESATNQINLFCNICASNKLCPSVEFSHNSLASCGTQCKFSITGILCCVSQTLKIFLLWCVLWNNFKNHCACSQWQIILFLFSSYFFLMPLTHLCTVILIWAESLCFCVCYKLHVASVIIWISNRVTIYTEISSASKFILY